MVASSRGRGSGRRDLVDGECGRRPLGLHVGHDFGGDSLHQLRLALVCKRGEVGTRDKLDGDGHRVADTVQLFDDPLGWARNVVRDRSSAAASSASGGASGTGPERAADATMSSYFHSSCHRWLPARPMLALVSPPGRGWSSGSSGSHPGHVRRLPARRRPAHLLDETFGGGICKKPSARRAALLIAGSASPPMRIGIGELGTGRTATSGRS